MDSRPPPYHEELLHWIWKTRHFDFRNLQTTDGQKITIHDTGTPNKSDGPDFRGAEITIGNLRWFGDAEIHWWFSDWKAHGHTGDPNFEQVILHIVFEDTEQTISRKDDSSIPTLCLSPYLAQPLKSFLTQYRRKPQLPCSGQFSFLTEESFSKQLQKAHKEYFEQKVNDLLDFYDPQLPPSQAWLKMFTIALFDGLGISHNRRPMRELAKKLFPASAEVESAAALRNQAINLSGIESSPRKRGSFPWKHKGMRPGSHPLPRIRQAADCLWFIRKQPFDHWKKNPKRQWDKMINAITATPSVGRERSSILFGTVYLPALYSLGNLFSSEQLQAQSWKLWKAHKAAIPGALLELLEQTKLSPEIYAEKLGTIYQLRVYCKPKNCQNCKVFKSAISS